MSDPTLTASQAEDDPIVTPRPPLFLQYAGDVSSTTLMRPTLIDGADATADQQATLQGGEDRWQASGCGPTSCCMIGAWYLSHPTLGPKLALASRDSDANPEQRGHLYLAKWLWDAAGNPLAKGYTATDRPPWTPRRAVGSSWNVNHKNCWTAFSSITLDGNALSYENAGSWSATKPDHDADDAKLKERATKRRLFKDRIVRCGPLAMNMNYAAHFVVLYGYRGSFMYILDPGMVIFNHWVKSHPDFVAQGGSLGSSKKDFTLYDSSTSQPIFTAFASSLGFGCHLAIDAEYTFPKVAVGGAKYGALAYLDAISLTVGFHFDPQNRFTEFLTAPAPDGRLPSNGAPVSPPSSPPQPPPPPASGPSQPSPSPSPSPPPTPAPTPSSSSDEPWYDEFLDWLLGNSSPQPPPAPTPGSQPVPAGAQATAVVTVVDDDTGSPLKGAEAEIVGIDKGNTDGKGVWTSRSFAPGDYNVKVRIKDYGPAIAPNHPTLAGQHSEVHTFGGGSESISVRMVNLKNARAFVWVLEFGSNKPLAGAEVEIVGKYKDNADAAGKAVTYAINPGKYHLKTRLDGYGPVAPARATPGETDRVIQLEKGDQAFIVFMQSCTWAAPAPPSGETIDSTQLQIVAPQTSLPYPLPQPIVFDYASNTWDVESKWSLIAPDGTVVDTNRHMGGGKYTLTPDTLDGYFKTAGSAVYGTWTLRYEKDAFYDDRYLVVWAALPDTGVPVPAAPPSTPGPPAPSGPNTPPPAPGTPGQIYTTNPNEVGTMTTIVPPHTVVNLARQYWSDLNDTGARMMAAQWAAETSNGQNCYNYNYGNVKGNSKQLHMYLHGTWELYKTPEGAQAAIDSSNGTARYPTDAERMKKGQPADAPMVMFDPPSSVARFRAFKSAEDGMASWVGVKQAIDKKYGGYLDALNSGDATSMAHILIALAHYATQKEPKYRDGIIKGKAWIDQQLGGAK